MNFRLAQAINSMPSVPETLFEIEVYFINYLGGSPCWSSSDIFSSESFHPIFGQLVGNVGQKPNHEAPANLQEVFSPLQIIINNWLNEISSGQDLYQLQIALSFFKTESEDGFEDFYNFLQRYFVACNAISEENSSQIMTEFSNVAWRETITIWRVVFQCIQARFPRRIIYGSLDWFFEFKSSLEIEMVYEYVLTGPWYVNIDFISFDPVFDPTSFGDLFDDVQLCLFEYFDSFGETSDEIINLKLGISNQFSQDQWDGRFESIISYYEGPYRTASNILRLPEFDNVLIRMKIIQKLH